MEALREKKRKYDDIAGAMNFEEDPLSENAAVYRTAVDAMTPTRHPPDSPIEQGGAVVLSKTRFSLVLFNSIFYPKSMFVFGLWRLLFEFCCYICCSILVRFVFILIQLQSSKYFPDTKFKMCLFLCRGRSLFEFCCYRFSFKLI
jgi:hypothetical protein